MELFIGEYLKNPYGKGVAGNFTPLKENYLKSYEKLNSKILCAIYKYRNSVIYHLNIPSDTTEDVSYDVVLEFDSSRLVNNSTSIMETNMKVFTNVPSFIYTYANVFYKHKLICKWLLDKYSKETLKHMPEVRNQFKVIGPEKYLYMAMYYIKDKGLERLNVISTIGKDIYDLYSISKYIRTEQEILQKRKPSSSEKIKNDKELNKILNDNDSKSKKKRRKKEDSIFSKSIGSIQSSRKIGKSKKIKKI